MTDADLNPDVLQWQRTASATTSFVFSVFHQLRMIEESIQNERMLSIDEIMNTIGAEKQVDVPIRRALEDFARANLARLYDAQASAIRREFNASPLIAFADIASTYVENDLGDHLQQVSHDIMSTLSPLADSEEGISGHQGEIFKIQALTQPTAETIRSGILAVAVGRFEQHLMQLVSIDENRVSAIPAGESKLSRLLRQMERSYAPTLNFENKHIPPVKEIIEARNALIHREGRVDARYIGSLPHSDIDDSNQGLILDTSIETMKHRVIGLLGFGLRATICSFRTRQEIGPADLGQERYATLLEYLAPGLSEIHLSDLIPSK